MESSLTTTLLRAWMWAVPIVMILAGAGFAVLAATGGSWGLFAMMLVLALFGGVLLALHWWVLYRFGRGADR